MFDELVESTKQKKGKCAGCYFVVTGLIYAGLLVAFGIVAVIGYHPVLAEEFDLLAKLALPVPHQDPPKPLVRRPHNAGKPLDGRIFIQLISDHFPPSTHIPPLENFRSGVPGGPPGDGARPETIGIGGDDTPPPPPRPAPKIEPAPAPEAVRKPLPVSTGVLQGKAIDKPKPIYPTIAKQVRASGPVQVLVTISEEGRVIYASAVNGHPTLRGAAEDAARRWRFTPTFLSNTPVKIQGMLTFNFILE